MLVRTVQGEEECDILIVNSWGHVNGHPSWVKDVRRAKRVRQATWVTGKEVEPG